MRWTRNLLQELLQSLEARQRRVWWFMIGTILLYVSLAFYTLHPEGRAVGTVAAPAVPLLCFVAAVACGGASRWLQCVLLSEQRLRAQLAREIDPRRLATDPQTGQVDEGRLAKLKGLERSDLQLLALADWSFTPVKVSLVLHEVLALCGLALSFLTQSRASIVPFVVAALMLDLPLFPRLDNMLRRAGRLMSHYSSGNGQKRPPQRDDFVTKI